MISPVHQPILDADHWYRSGSTFQFEQHQIYYREEGSGPNLLLIHGFPTSSWDWARIWSGLVSRFQVIAVDLLGFGHSAKPNKTPYSIMTQADLLTTILTEKGIHKVHVLAHDYGNTVAQELLARQTPQGQEATEISSLMIESICFLNGGIFPETQRPRLIQRLLRSPLGFIISRFMNVRTFSRSFAAVFGPNTQPSEPELRSFWNIISHQDGHRRSHQIIRYIDERHRHRDRWVGPLTRSLIPMRLINGPLDPVSGRHMLKRYRQLVPDPDTIILEGIGHYPQIEDSVAVLIAYLAFFEKHFGISEPKELL